MLSIGDIKELLQSDKSAAVKTIDRPRGGEVYLFAANGGIGAR